MDNLILDICLCIVAIKHLFVERVKSPGPEIKVQKATKKIKIL